ncbi:hypothetical protein NP493_576g01021 [Ridgeia piscesae]|uniref:Uncharacterized protein n=1 Tax=Ridgeia piscesae TaxID=27915 RepID=A0AAD9KV06_RIDPI|nr:hypothetical protein NP493_576g01021 [Ridgeia piscesae]
MSSPMVVIQVQLAVSSLLVVILVQLLSVISGGCNYSHNWQVSTFLAILIQLASVIEDCNPSPTGKCYQFISDTRCHHVCIQGIMVTVGATRASYISVQCPAHCSLAPAVSPLEDVPVSPLEHVRHLKMRPTMYE